MKKKSHLFQGIPGEIHQKLLEKFQLESARVSKKIPKLFSKNFRKYLLTEIFKNTYKSPQVLLVVMLEINAREFRQRFLHKIL